MATNLHLEPLATQVSFSATALRVVLVDGREISIPLEWLPRLREATAQQREKWEFIGDGVGIHWPDLDEDVLVEDLLAVPRR